MRRSLVDWELVNWGTGDTAEATDVPGPDLPNTNSVGRNISIRGRFPDGCLGFIARFDVCKDIFLGNPSARAAAGDLLQIHVVFTGNFGDNRRDETQVAPGGAVRLVSTSLWVVGRASRSVV